MSKTKKTEKKQILRCLELKYINWYSKEIQLDVLQKIQYIM